MRKQHLNFRREDVTYITDRWKAVEPCSLVGVGSVGKSNLLHHLSDTDVHQKYMGRSPSEFRSIIIDPHLLGPLPPETINLDQYTCWAGFELIMHRLYMAFYPFEFLNDSHAQRFYELYRTLQDGTNPIYSYMGLRYLELALQILIDNGIQLVLMFDEFEQFLNIMPPKFFQVLRGIRDNYKSQLSYLTFTRSPLPLLVDRMNIAYLEIEPFLELFTDNTIYIGPYNDTDATHMLNLLVRRNPKLTYPDHIYEFLFHATGKYAGIMRAAFRMLDTLGTISPDNTQDDQLIQKLAQRESVKTECRTIWLSLSSIEQQVLKAVARISPYHESEAFDNAIKILVQKRLLKIDRSSETLTIEPPVFKFFVQTDPDSQE